METDLQGFNNKDFLIGCINSAINQIQGKGQLKGITIEFDEGMLNEPGAGRVSETMFRKIDECDIFIGDLTVVQRLHHCGEKFRNKKHLFFRYTPNCNVYGEYNRALGRYDESWKQIILLMNKANRSVNDDWTVVPFDTRDVRWPIQFTLADDSEEGKASAKSELMKVLPLAIQKCALAARDHIHERYQPFVTWEKHAKDGNLKSYKVDSSIIAKYEKVLNGNNKPVCVVGPKGYAKTVLVRDAFSDPEKSNNYLYVDNDDCSYDLYRPVLEKLFDKVPDAIIVVDGCTPDFASKVLKLKRRYNAGNKVVVIIDSEKLVDGLGEESKYVCLDVTEELKQIIDNGYAQTGIKAYEQKEFINDFCENRLGLVMSVAKNIGDVSSNGDLNSELLTTKLLSAETGTDDRKIMQTLSLFECVGWSAERKNELEYILSNKAITNIYKDGQQLLNDTIALIKKNIKNGVIIEEGRTIRVTPKPMAIQLVKEWLLSVDSDRFLEVIKSISSSELSETLTREFHDQFRFLGESEDAREIVGEILKVGGAFDSFDVINSDIIARLIEAFVQVNPNAVCYLLVRVLNAKTIEELKSLVNGRRYIVWAIEKLCFLEETFVQGAQMMMRLALAENEEISNNATGEFIRLFPVMLPATSANLSIRLKFLQDAYKIENNRPMIMRALRRALLMRNFIYFGGAEKLGNQELKPYQPQTRTEIKEYIDGCINLVINEIRNGTVLKEEAISIFEDCTVSLCLFGMGGSVLPVVKNVAEILGGKWEKMQQTLSFFKQRIKQNITPEEQLIFDETLSLITQQDFVSRFKRVEKVYFSDDKKLGFEERLKKQQDDYVLLAEEMYDKHLFDENTIKEILATDSISTVPFGATLAKKMNEEEQIEFIEKYVEILNSYSKSRIDIICNFVQELDPAVFDKVIPILQNSSNSTLLFACFGQRNVMPIDSDYFGLLKERIDAGMSSVEDYLQYWTRLRINTIDEDNLCILFTEVLKCDMGIHVALRMGSFIIMDARETRFSRVEDILADAITSYDNDQIPLLRVGSLLHVAEMLLVSGNRPGLALKINSEVLTMAKDVNIYLGHNYELESVYRVLMAKYFDVIWASLSDVLLSDGADFMSYYILKNFLGVDMVYENQTPVILEGEHIAELMEWCEKYPDVAPARLAGMIPVASENSFTPLALALIDKFADRKYVLNEIGCNLDSFSSVGSIVPYYQRRKAIYSTLFEHQNEAVRIWAQQQVNACDYMINREGEREQEKI